MGLNTNKDRLVKISVMGQIDSPTKYITYNISYDGVPRVLPGIGGITYNVRIGDLACGWQADHVEPGVSTKNLEKIEGRSSPNLAYNVLACIGNEAIVATGDAKGSRGYVVGKHGGIEHVLEDLRLGDIVAIKDADTSFGRFYKKGALTIGIVVHTNSYIAGHGPGVTSLMTSSKGKIIPELDPNANIKNYLGL